MFLKLFAGRITSPDSPLMVRRKQLQRGRWKLISCFYIVLDNKTLGICGLKSYLFKSLFLPVLIFDGLWTEIRERECGCLCINYFQMKMLPLFEHSLWNILLAVCLVWECFWFSCMCFVSIIFDTDSESSNGSGSNPSSPTKPSPIRFPVLPSTSPKSPTGKISVGFSTTPPGVNHMSTSSGSGMWPTIPVLLTSVFSCQIKFVMTCQLNISNISVGLVNACNFCTLT